MILRNEPLLAAAMPLSQGLRETSSGRAVAQASSEALELGVNLIRNLTGEGVLVRFWIAAVVTGRGMRNDRSQDTQRDVFTRTPWGQGDRYRSKLCAPSPSLGITTDCILIGVVQLEGGERRQKVLQRVRSCTSGLLRYNDTSYKEHREQGYDGNYRKCDRVGFRTSPGFQLLQWVLFAEVSVVALPPIAIDNGT